MEQEQKFEIRGFAKFLFVMLAAGFIVAIMMVFVTNKVRAERWVVLKDGTMTIWADVMKVPGVPKEITDPETAFKLVSGQLGEAVVTSQETLYPFEFPMFKRRVVYTDSKVTYSNGKWVVVPYTPKIVDSNLYLVTSFVFIALAVCVAIAIMLMATWIRSINRQVNDLTAQIDKSEV